MDRDLRTLWCGNLSNRVTEDVLYELFLQAGPLDDVKIPKDRDSRPRAYGFITYKHDESVGYALELFRGTSLYNRELCIDRKMRLPQEQLLNNQEEMIARLCNVRAASMGLAILPTPLQSFGPSAYPNPYSSHIQLGHQGPANMYPTKDRRNLSRKHPYYRN